jgi:hypothetical protein
MYKTKFFGENRMRYFLIASVLFLSVGCHIPNPDDSHKGEYKIVIANWINSATTYVDNYKLEVMSDGSKKLTVLDKDKNFVGEAILSKETQIGVAKIPE